MKKYILLLLCFISLSCSPVIRYFGDAHPVTEKVDSYYSPNDVHVNHKVIGQLKAYQRLGTSMEELKILMIEEAKLKGANGILFILDDVETEPGTAPPVRAELLLYLD